MSLGDLEELFRAHGMVLEAEDQRQEGEALDIELAGELTAVCPCNRDLKGPQDKRNPVPESRFVGPEEALVELGEGFVELDETFSGPGRVSPASGRVSSTLGKVSKSPWRASSTSTRLSTRG